MQPIIDYFSPKNTRCLVIAEVAQTHDGDIDLAHKFIDAAADAGADAIKYQTHIAAAESTAREAFRVKFSDKDKTRYDYWKRMEFTKEQWQGLAEHARKRGLHFLSSPFSLEAVDLLNDIGMEVWKIASGEIGNVPMLKRIAATGRPVILSTGLSTWEDIDRAVKLLQSNKTPVALLQTTTMYPTPPEYAGLNVISELQKRYGCVVGLSDHSATIYPGLASYVLGGRILEVHLTLSRDMFGPDVSSSLTPEDLKTLTQGLRFLETAFTHPVDKEAYANEVAPLRTLFGKSVVARQNLPAGQVLSEHDITLKKPGGGIPATEIEQLYGAVLQRSIAADEALTYNDVKLKRG